jgi:hypothetical protein
MPEAARILTFASIHDALRAEKTLLALAAAGGMPPGELVPLPPAIRSDCGFGLLLDAAASVGARYTEALRESGVEIEGAYRVIESESKSGKGYRKERSYERID